MKLLRGLFILVIVLLNKIPAGAQNDWQQTINYNIRVKLDDEKHILRGNVTIEYVNNSPDTLEHLYFHCWPNAYSSPETPFAQQLLENGNTDFYFARQEKRGYLDSLNFTHNGNSLDHSFQDRFNEIGKLKLPNSLKPGEKIKVQTPFRVKLPSIFSRMGHDGQFYSITQWYPKIATYDENGWHTMHYLEQGEFYNDFGQYHVEITLPANYVVGATGELQNEAEKEWLKRQDSLTRAKLPFSSGYDTSIPASSDSNKTLVYKIDSVHDFAWFADKRFFVLMDTVRLAKTGYEITTYSMFMPSNARDFRESPKYIDQAITTLSQKVGPYPYDMYTVVNGPMGTGGGMEYPTITIVSAGAPALTIFHEVTHSWFQGILAFNERKYPFLDEGLTSFYEKQYFESWEIGEGGFGDLIEDQNGYAGFYNTFMKYLAHHQERVAKDQPPGLHSEKFTSINYGAMVYAKAPWLFQYLYGYLGRKQFNEAMQSFYEEHKFTHPGPEDLQKSFMKVTGDSLNWFFQDLMMEGKRLDYSINGFANDEKTIVKLKNKGQVKGPVLITQHSNERMIARKWVPGFYGVKEVSLPESSFYKVKINPLAWVPEYNYRNNQLYKNSLSDLFNPLKPELFVNPDGVENNRIFLNPAVGYNGSDGLMLGGLVTNSLFPPQNFEIAVAPLFGFKSNRLAGMGMMTYNWYKQDKKAWRNWEIGLKGRRFSYESSPRTLSYNKLEPSIEYQFEPKPLRTGALHTINLQSNLIEREEYRFNIEENKAEEITERYYVNEVSYSYDNQATLKSFTGKLTAQQHEDFVKVFTELKGFIPYERKDQGLEWRIFGGSFLHYDQSMAPEYNFLLGNRYPALDNQYTDFRDNQDYTYDQLLIDRGARTGVWAHQVWENNGNFKVPTAYGTSRDWLVAANLISSIPGNTPLRVFADVGTSSELAKETYNNVIAYDAGVALVLWKDVLEFYYPIFFSNDLDTILENNDVRGLDKLQFQLNINFEKILEMRERLDEAAGF